VESWRAPDRCLLVSVAAGPGAGHRAHSVGDPDCQGTANTDHSGYHETLTRFWIGVVVTFLEARDSQQPELDGVNQLVETCAARSGLWREFYSFDLIQSVESRRQWIEPDRKAL